MERAALFSLQVHAECVETAAVDSRGLVLAFQLLQLDIVLLDSPSRDGQSCLFQSDADSLAAALRDDEHAAFVWLVLEREDQRARLVAFACVGLAPPHVAVNGTGRARVSEWASVEATWALVDHANKTVGSVRGSITLACLGSALAPHLQMQQFAERMQLLTRPSEQQSELETSQDDEENKQGEPVEAATDVHTSVVEATSPPLPAVQQIQASPKDSTKKEELRDAAVQCDEDEEGADRYRNPKPILIHGGDVRRRKGSPRTRLVDELDRIKISETASPKLKSKRADGHGERRAIRISYDERDPQRFTRRREEGTLFIESEQPPPLYFHKPKGSHAKHHSATK